MLECGNAENDAGDFWEVEKDAMLTPRDPQFVFVYILFVVVSCKRPVKCAFALQLGEY